MLEDQYKKYIVVSKSHEKICRNDLNALKTRKRTTI